VHYDKYLTTNQEKLLFLEKLFVRHEEHRGQIVKNLCWSLLSGIANVRPVLEVFRRWRRVAEVEDTAAWTENDV